jgi:hypothetical protein
MKPTLTYEECEEIVGELFIVSLGIEDGILKFDDLEELEKHRIVQFYDTHCISTNIERISISQQEMNYDSFIWFANEVVVTFNLITIEEDELKSWYKLYFTEETDSDSDESLYDSFDEDF